MLWCVLEGFFSVIGILNSGRLEEVEQFPGVFVLMLLLLLHITSFGSSISIPWGWKHQVHVDKPSCSWSNLDLLLLSWILPPGRILVKHFGRKAPEKSPSAVLSVPKRVGLFPLLENTGKSAEIVNISGKWMEESANLVLSPISLKLIIVKRCLAICTTLCFCRKCRGEEFKVICFSLFNLGNLTWGFFRTVLQHIELNS